ncbi:MAG: FAD binding domain-containing protein [Cyanobacteria bacterium REEB67]|nr:FAD binding domain-containing protein [Cyanobacteria bacterium REEB67]
MRDFVLLYINGREHRLRGVEALQPLSDFLRLGLNQCGTKVVCAEGDCGACSVMIGRSEAGRSQLTYVPVNSCIQFVYQLDLAHIVTVEGLKVDAELNEVQRAMVDCNGAQCGYCTPGFVVALCGAANQLCSASKGGGQAAGANRLSEKQVKDSLTGNLCRCTGYEAIIKAGMDFDLKKFQPFSALYEEKPIIAAFNAQAVEPVLIEADGRKVFLPATIDSAVDFLKKSPDATIVSGGTDISVNINKRGLAPQTIMSLCNLSGLDQINESDAGGRKTVTVGARVSLSRLERYFEKIVPEFYKVLWVYGSPQIRQAGTLAGNIGNGSPIADSLPFLFAVDASIEVTGSGGSRVIPMQSFYTGYKKMAMKKGEMITRIIIPLPTSDELLRLYKVTRRQHLDISTFTAAIVVKTKSDKITYARVVLGGVGPVVLRLTKVEDFLIGKIDKIETYKEAGRLARQEIEPLDDVRGSRAFRLQLAENIFQKYYFDVHDIKEKVLTGGHS